MIARVLEEKREGFTAKDLCKELPHVGRATVFRTLKLFIEVGVLCKLEPMGGAPLYSVCGAGHHHHSVCILCGLVEELRSGTVEQMLRSISNDVPGEVVGHLIEFYVDCKQVGCERRR